MAGPGADAIRAPVAEAAAGFRAGDSVASGSRKLELLAALAIPVRLMHMPPASRPSDLAIQRGR